MKKGFITAIVVAVMSFILAITMGVYMIIDNSNKEYKYVIYVGVSQDDTTTSQRNEIEEKADEICRKHTDGFTKLEGEGGFRNDDDVFVKEKTFVYEFCFTNEETVNAIAKEILSTLEDVTILMEKVENNAVHSSSGYFNETTDTTETE